MIRALPLALSACLALAACGRGEPGNGGGATSGDASQLDKAKSQMDPTAAAAVDDAIDNGATPQEALAAGGNAQATTVNTPQAPADSSVGARPNRDGQRVPPAKIDTDTQPGVTGGTGASFGSNALSNGM